MPVEKSARVSVRRRQRNVSLRSAVKTHITKAQSLINQRDLTSAEEAVRQAIVTLDKAAIKGVIHPNNAARRKSRLMKKLNATKSSS